MSVTHETATTHLWEIAEDQSEAEAQRQRQRPRVMVLDVSLLRKGQLTFGHELGSGLRSACQSSAAGIVIVVMTATVVACM